MFSRSSVLPETSLSALAPGVMSFTASLPERSLGLLPLYPPSAAGERGQPLFERPARPPRGGFFEKVRTP